MSGKNKIISTGYNGFPSNMPDNEEWYNDRSEKYDRIIHCEMNALLYGGKLESPYGYTLYTYPFISCSRCFVHMLQAGITRFVAPIPTEDQLSRWGESFAKTKRYAKDCSVEIIELDYGSNNGLV